MATEILLKRGLNANLASVTLKAGEPAFVTDTGKLYIGDGTSKVIINPVGEVSGLDVTNSYTKVKVNEYGQVVEQANLVADDIPDIPNTKVTGLGTASVCDTGTAAGNVPVLDADGKLNGNVLPAIAITDTFVVENEAAMLALDAQIGDIAVRTDIDETFILQTSDATVLGHWVKLLEPTVGVTSVNGQTGVVVLSPTDLSMTGYAEAVSYTAIQTTDTLSVAVGKLEKNFDNYATLGAEAVFTVSPKAPTPDAGDDSTNVATTAFVKNALTVLDGGTF